MVGRIVTVVESRGFCWVRAHGVGKDCFLHVSQLMLPDDTTFTVDELKGKEVDFTLEVGDRGPMAKSARLVTEWQQ